MKKMVFTVVFIGMVATTLASPILFETFQASPITIPAGTDTTTTVIELSFSVDTSCYVQLNTGGNVGRASMGLVLDGETLWPEAKTNAVYPFTFSIPYSTFLAAGQHEIIIKITTNMNQDYSTTCSDAYLQALIFLPDAAGAVAEQQPPVEPTPAMESVISKGPYVFAPGASTVVDASGRIMGNVLSEGKVEISNLPAGTYYAKDKERTVVKIVKVD